MGKRSSSVLSAHNTTPSQSLSVSICFLLVVLIFSNLLPPSLYYISLAFFIFSSSLSSAPVFLSLSLLSFPLNVFSSTGCLFHFALLQPLSPHLTLISSTLSSSDNHLCTFLLLSPSSNHHLIPSIPPHLPFPLRLSLLGTLYLLSPSLAASVYYLFSTEAGETDRTSPSEDFPPNSPAAVCR